MVFSPLIDVSVSVINLIQELTDVDSLNESVEGAKMLIDALVSFDYFDCLLIGG